MKKPKGMLEHAEAHTQAIASLFKALLEGKNHDDIQPTFWHGHQVLSSMFGRGVVIGGRDLDPKLHKNAIVVRFDEPDWWLTGGLDPERYNPNESMSESGLYKRYWADGSDEADSDGLRHIKQEGE